MFSLSPAGRHNLEAICVELERAARQHPPLFHQQLKPWSVKGEVRITEPQWAAFIENEGQCLSEEVWCDWHGPFDDYLGIWHGSPDGLEEFCDLIESLAMVLRREDFSDIDPLDLRIEFESVHEWLMTLHQWAMRFSLPLLRGFGELWNGETDDPNEYNRLIQIWGGVGDVSYPMHPLIFNLRYNVYTSSIAAIRALTQPECTMTEYEPWPLLSLAGRRKEEAAELSHSHVAEIQACEINEHSADVQLSHNIVEIPGKWYLLPAGSETPFIPLKQSGLIRVAALIHFKPQEFTPLELSRFGAKTFNGAGIGRHAVRDGEWVGPSKQKQDDRQERRDAERELRELAEERERAKKDGDRATLDRVNLQIRAISKTFNVGEDGKTIKPQRPFRSKDWKKSQDTVARTIRQFWDELDENNLSSLRTELERQIKLPTLAFNREEDCTPWVVRRMIP